MLPRVTLVAWLVGIASTVSPCQPDEEKSGKAIEKAIEKPKT